MITDLNKSKTFALSCPEVKRQLYKLHSTEWFEKLRAIQRRKIRHYRNRMKVLAIGSTGEVSLPI
jgi:hypothetical protein